MRSPSSPVPEMSLSFGCCSIFEIALLMIGDWLAAADEHQQRCLGVTPGEMARGRLPEGVPDHLWPLPDLAFGDEDVAVPGADEDVGTCRLH